MTVAGQKNGQHRAYGSHTKLMVPIQSLWLLGKTIRTGVSKRRESGTDSNEQ